MPASGENFLGCFCPPCIEKIVFEGFGTKKQKQNYSKKPWVPLLKPRFKISKPRVPFLKREVQYFKPWVPIFKTLGTIFKP